MLVHASYAAADAHRPDGPRCWIQPVFSTLMVVFVILDGEVARFEGAMLLGLYVVLGSLFWWS